MQKGEQAQKEGDDNDFGHRECVMTEGYLGQLSSRSYSQAVKLREKD